jgi:choline kinase
MLAGRPLLHYLLDSIRAAGVDDIVLVAGYQAEQLDAPGCRKVLNSAYADTNMVGTLFAAAECMEEGADLLISYADTVFEPRVIHSVLEQRVGDIVIASDDCWQNLWSRRMADPLGDAETFRMDSDERIWELGRKPKTAADIQGQYMGLFKIRGSRIDDLKRFYSSLDRTVEYDRQPFQRMFMTSLLQALIDSGWHAQAARTNGGWLEVDSVEDLQLYEGLAQTGELDSLCRLAATEVQ